MNKLKCRAKNAMLSLAVDSFLDRCFFLCCQKGQTRVKRLTVLFIHKHSRNEQSAKETFIRVFVCHQACVWALWETDGKVWVTTWGHDTSWHIVGVFHPTTPLSIFNLHPDFFLCVCVSLLFPLFFNLSRAHLWFWVFRRERLDTFWHMTEVGQN